MAATVGATLSGVTFALRHAGEGPFISSAGNVYFFGRDSVNTGQVEPHKASDPTSAFTAQTLKTMSSATSTAIEAMACYQVGQVIHVATQISTGQTYYNFYTMDTDAWGLTTSETAVAAASFAPVSGATFVDLVVRSGGEVVIAYCAGQTAMSSGFNMWRYTRRTATNTFSAPVNVDNGGSINWFGGPALLGASDRVHFFLLNFTSNLSYQRTLSSANALQTFPASFGTCGGQIMATRGAAYDDGGTTRVRLGYYSGTSPFLAEVAKFDSADTPSVSVDTSVSASSIRVINNQARVGLVNDGTNVHILWTDTTLADLFHDSSAAGGGAWGADVNELAGTINAISPNVYARSGNKYLAMVLDDGGTIKYAEILIPWSFPNDPNRLYSRILAVR